MILIYANGDCTFSLDEKPTLQSLQHAVGGYIEVLDLSPRWAMVINEEGKIEGLPVNYGATTIAREHNALRGDDVIVGNAVIVHKTDMKR